MVRVGQIVSQQSGRWSTSLWIPKKEFLFCGFTQKERCHFFRFRPFRRPIARVFLMRPPPVLVLAGPRCCARSAAARMANLKPPIVSEASSEPPSCVLCSVDHSSAAQVLRNQLDAVEPPTCAATPSMREGYSPSKTRKRTSETLVQQ